MATFEKSVPWILAVIFDYGMASALTELRSFG